MVFCPVLVYLVSWKLLLPHFLHLIASLIHHALDYVLAYLRYPWTGYYRDGHELFMWTCTTRHLVTRYDARD
jgi:hypothetical protein